MSSYVFPGHPKFVEEAASVLGHPESAGPARRIIPLTALANLCAQAATAHPDDARAILAKAREFRDQIATALLAADTMLDDVHDSLGLVRPILNGSTAPAKERPRPLHDQLSRPRGRK